LERIPLVPLSFCQVPLRSCLSFVVWLKVVFVIDSATDYGARHPWDCNGRLIVPAIGAVVVKGDSAHASVQVVLAAEVMRLTGWEVPCRNPVV
jgi:hypothetical protein